MAMCSIFVTMVKGYSGLLAYVVIFGFFEGCYVVLIPVITSDIVGAEKLSYALGSMFTFMAFPMMLGPPIAGTTIQTLIGVLKLVYNDNTYLFIFTLGWIYDLTNDYTVAFYLCGATAFLPACLMFLIPCLTPPRKDSPSASSPSTPRRQEVKPNRATDTNTSTMVVAKPQLLSRSYYGPGLLNDKGCLYEAPNYDIIRALSLAKL